jgi:hypothetical protein
MEINIWSWAANGWLITRQTGQLTVSHIITLSLILNTTTTDLHIVKGDKKGTQCLGV